MGANSLQEGAHEARVFAAAGKFDAARDVDAARAQGLKRGGDVVGSQAAGDQALGAHLARRGHSRR